MARVLARSLALGWLASALVGAVGCSSFNPGRIPFVTTNSEIEGQLAMARYAEQGQDFERAKQLYQSVIEKRPRNPMPYHRLAVIAAREEHPEVADQFFAQARERAPEDPELLADIGYQHYMQRRLPEAEAVLREAVDRDPKHQRSLNNLGLVLGQQGRFDEALALFRRGGTDADSHANLAFVYAFHGHYDLAKRHYSIALTKDPGLKSAAEALVELARVVPDPKPPVPGAQGTMFAGGPGAPGAMPGPAGMQMANHTQPAAGPLPGIAPAEQQAPYHQSIADIGANPVSMPSDSPSGDANSANNMQSAGYPVTPYPVTSPASSGEVLPAAQPVEPGMMPPGEAQNVIPLPPITAG